MAQGDRVRQPRAPAVDATAPQNTATPTPAVPGRPSGLTYAGPAAVTLGGEVHRAGADVGGASPSGPGQALPGPMRQRLESSFGVDLSPVRLHTDAHAERTAASLSARAVTVGRHIFLGPGERPNDVGLMAHEVAHVVQQRAVPTVQLSGPAAGDALEREAQRAAVAALHGEPARIREQVSQPRVQRLGISDALDYFADKANIIPGFRMFTIIIGVNPINMSRVERSAANILRAIVEFLPGGGLITQALDNYGIFERVGAWIEDQISTLGITGASIRRAVLDFLDSLSWRDIFRLGSVWDRAKRIFTDPIDRLISFGRSLISGIIRFVKEAILKPLAKLAEGTRGYDLLKAVLGQDPITGEPVPRNADTLIGGFMKLIGQEEVWNNLKRANAVARAWAWFQGALAGLLGFVRQIPSLFISALTQLELMDIVLVPRAFSKIARVFGGFIGQFLSWAGQQVLSLLQIIFEVVAPSVMPYIRRAAGAFRMIIENPVRFVGNLVRAGIQGFRQFAGNFLNHLRRSLIEWLTGTLSGASIYIPQALELREIVKFVLSVLGLTWQNIRQKLVRLVGEPVVAALEGAFDLVVTLVREGPAAAWERIRESLSNLRDMVMEQIMTFVRDRVVQAAITRLVTSLNPAGAFIQAIIATYNTIMFFVERLQQIARVVMSFIDSIAAIASGNIGTAASRVETTMAGMLTLLISFLARIAGLGRVSDAVKNIVDRVRQPIDRALDRVVEWIRARAAAFVARVGGGTPEERLDRAVAAGRAAVNRFAGRRVGAVVLRPLLAAIRMRYRLTSLDVVAQGAYWAVSGVVNPRKAEVTDAAVGEGAEAPEYSLIDEPGEIQGRGELTAQNGALAGDDASTRSTFGYVATVPAILSSNATDIAQRYGEQGFEGGNAEAARRFSLSIGVNAFEDLRGRNAAELPKWTTGFSAYPIAIIRFLWRPRWRKGVAGMSFDVARRELAGKDAIIDAVEGGIPRNQRVIPYGAIRNAILVHPATQTFIGNLRKRVEHVYVHIGDADAVSLRGSKPLGAAGAIRVNAAAVGRALFARYDELLRGAMRSPGAGGTPPVLASGGYRLRLRAQGDLGPVRSEQLTALASELDMQIRVAMGRINPRTVYFAEPNTVIRVDPDGSLEGIFSGGRTEGARMVQEVQSRWGQQASMLFNERLSIITSSGRLQFEGGEGDVPISVATLRDLSESEVRRLFELTQSHARLQVWVAQVMSAYPKQRILEDSLRALAELYFPNLAIGYDPARLREQLPTFNTTRRDPSSAVLEGLGDRATQQQIVRLARDTGRAIRLFLLDVLSIRGA